MKKFNLLFVLLGAVYSISSLPSQQSQNPKELAISIVPLDIANEKSLKYGEACGEAKEIWQILEETKYTLFHKFGIIFFFALGNIERELTAYKNKADDTETWMVAKDKDGKIVGLVSFILIGKKGFIQRLAVSYSAQGRNVGTKLLVYALDKLVEMGAQTLALYEKNWIPAKKLFERYGFKKVVKSYQPFEDLEMSPSGDFEMSSKEYAEAKERITNKVVLPTTPSTVKPKASISWPTFNQMVRFSSATMFLAGTCYLTWRMWKAPISNGILNSICSLCGGALQQPCHNSGVTTTGLLKTTTVQPVNASLIF